MTVNLTPDDRTWQIHLDGLLTMLRQPRTFTKKERSPTAEANQSDADFGFSK